MDRAGNQKEAWITCPLCERIYNVEKFLLEDQQFADLLLFCPFCQREFDRRESPKVYGMV
jgi:hypothetical protein